MFRGGFEPWHLILIIVVLALLFGYRKFPSMTKSVAQSLKIFRDETKGLRGEHDDETTTTVTTAATGQPGVHVASEAGSRTSSNSNAGAIAAPVTIPSPPPAQPEPAVQEPAAVAAPGTHSLAPKPRTQTQSR